MYVYKVCIPPNTAKYQQSQLHLALHENYADTPVLKDIVSGDEIISDTWGMKEVEGTVYEIDCRMVTKGAEHIDIGANPSAEEQEETLDQGAEKVLDVPDAFGFVYLGNRESGERAFKTTKEYFEQLKPYIKNVVAKLKEDPTKDAEFIKGFQSRAASYYKKVIAPNFEDYEFYAGSSANVQGMVVLLNYREDGITPYLTVWKDGLEGQKS